MTRAKSELKPVLAIQSQLSKFLFLIFLCLTSLSACNEGIGAKDRPSVSSSSNSASRNQIFASLSKTRRAIPPGLVCFNVNAVRVGSWHDPNFIAAVKRLAPQVLRIPGGEGSNYWDWQRGGLKQELPNLPEGLPQFLRYNDRKYTASQLKDFKAGFESTGTTPLFALNMLSSTLEAELNMLKQAQNMGIPIREIELGNEFYFPTQNYRTIFPKPESYAQTASMWVAKIKQVFPEAKISVIGVEYKEQSRGFRQDHWNRLVFPSALRQADAATIHIYTQTGLNPESQPLQSQYPFFEEQDVPIILGEPFRYWENQQGRKSFRDVPQGKKIWITEYNLLERFSNKENDPKPRVLGSWAHGLHTLALTLLFLEEPRVEKLCNHMLVGNSQFAAIFADAQSFRHPTDPKEAPTSFSVPFGLTASGSAMQLFGHGLHRATSAQKIDFQGVPMLTGKEQIRYPALLGWVFANDQHQKRAIIMNVSDQPLQADLKKILPSGIHFKQLSGDPKTLVTGPGMLDERQGRINTVLALPAYSTTLLVEP